MKQYDYKFNNEKEMRAEGFEYNGFHGGRVLDDEPIFLIKSNDIQYKAFQEVFNKVGYYTIDLGYVAK